MDFKKLEIKEEVVNILTEMGITSPTEIQEKVIPEIKKGIDLVGISKTGSGKTIAFTLPLIDKISVGTGIQALIVVPVRELAEQVGKEIRKFARHIRPNVTVIYGGVSLFPQKENLKKADIVVGTPGRLLDHINRRNIDFSKVKIVVLDEADKMASLGFIEDVEMILKATPKTRQTLLFGATISEEISLLKQKYMKNPIIIKSIPHVSEAYLNQFYYDVQMREKFSMLVHLIVKEKPNLAMIFCSTRRNAELVSKNLQNQVLDAQVLHGGISQSSRLKILEGFHNGKPSILVATAVAARGLDIKNVTHIFNYDVPKNPEEYIHQIGRTARAGEHGKAITLLSQNDHDNFSNILRRYPVKVNKLPKEQFQLVHFDIGRNNFRHQRIHQDRMRHRYNA